MIEGFWAISGAVEGATVDASVEGAVVGSVEGAVVASVEGAVVASVLDAGAVVSVEATGSVSVAAPVVSVGGSVPCAPEQMYCEYQHIDPLYQYNRITITYVYICI